MTDPEPQSAFVDTNVLLYAYDPSAGHRHHRARALVERLWATGTGALSVQVLQEFYVNATTKVPGRLSSERAESIVSDLGRWRTHVPTAPHVLGAIAVQRRFRISFWDAMIVQSASELGCDVIWTEDLNDGQRYGTVVARNPFTTEVAEG